ncbi:hypothetical protein RB195_016453 [Necator americanus]|uniref:WD repeat-containing protein 79 n=1 Tax=Necator americanus TaxID=51031 RepID=A0ABR1C339_NECAM
MLRDEQRGWAWTRALLGVAADEVHLCGESAAIEIVKKLLDPIGEHVEVRYYERKTPLTIANQGLGSLDHVQSGDCIVCFSRKAIYNVTKSLEKLGVKPAVIYGDLPPGTKLAQAAKFNDPNDPCNVLVATDAIGMGLNLNIRRIIFSGCTRQGELLPNYSALQIAGRAGRFGTTYSDGIATTLRNEDIGTLKDILSQPVEPIETVGIAPTFEQIETFSFHLPQASFVHLLDLFVSVCSISDQFFICTVEQMRTLADLIDYIPLPLKVRYTFCISPINVESKLTAAAFVKMVRRFSSGQCLTYDWMMDMLNWESIGQPENLQQLEHLEKIYEVLDTYLWLSLRFPDMLPDELAVREACKQLDAILQESVENILEILENSAMGDARKGSILKKMRERAQTQREKEEYEAEKKKEMKLPGKRKGMRKSVLHTESCVRGCARNDAVETAVGIDGEPLLAASSLLFGIAPPQCQPLAPPGRFERSRLRKRTEIHIRMNTDEEIPGSCIIEGALDNTMPVGEAVKTREEELNMVKSNYTGAEVVVVDVINQLLDRVQIESAAFRSTTDGRHVEEGLNREIEAKMEVETNAFVEGRLSTTLITPDAVCRKETPIEQPSSSRGEPEKKAIMESILAKLENTAVKLNRRERRALQRELEAAQGIERTFPVSIQQQTSVDAWSISSIPSEGFDVDHNIIMPKDSGRGGSSCKRPATVVSGNHEATSKVLKIQEPPLALVIRKSAFKFDNVAMHPHDSVKRDFCCARLGYVSTSFPANNFLKLCRFSPSGSSVATTSADNSARIFELSQKHMFSLAVKIPLGDPIYDTTWLCGNNEKQYLATTAKHHPIHLWSEDGTRFSSYRGINHLDELTAAYSVAFSNDGAQLYGGYDACIRIWDTSRPGRQHTSIKTWEKRTGGQKSVVSCIVMNKSFAGVYAAATYDGSVGFYSDRTNSLECMFSTETVGITDMHYSSDGQRLFVAPRKSDEILCYDMRMPGTLIFKMLRPFTTNQRACFDLDSADSYLFSGTSDGQFVVFDLNSNAIEKLPFFSRKVADCSVPCVSVHDAKIPMIALGTGERVFPTPKLTTISEDSSDSSDSEEERLSYRRRRRDSELSNSLQLWRFL